MFTCCTTKVPIFAYYKNEWYSVRRRKLCTDSKFIASLLSDNKNEWYSVRRRKLKNKYTTISILMYIIYKNEWYSVRRRKQTTFLYFYLNDFSHKIRMNYTPQGDGNVALYLLLASFCCSYKNEWYSIRRRKLFKSVSTVS